MGQKKRTEQLVLNIGIALTAGMFSIVPVAYGAPVGGVVKSGDAEIKQVTAAAGGIDTNITSTTLNNVIDWQDFSVAKDESVNFDGKNYLNIVSGQNTSQIDGAITSGGGNIYLVNPNGVIFGKGSSVNVGAGSFNVSTRYLDSAKAAQTVTDTTAISTVIDNASSTVASDIVNMGSISAKSVVLEGNNIRFMNSGTTDNTVNVTNDDISFQSSANGYVHIGNSTGTGVSGYKVNGTNNDSLTVAQKKNTYYQLIDSMSGITKAGGNYMLSKNITSASGYSGTFTGKFDGMGFTISGFTANDGGGLFKATQGALIENLGVTNINISDPQDNGAGGIIGTASSGTVLRNVYSTGLIQNGSTVGGLVGNANGVTIDHSYSSVTITSGEGAGIIGYVASGTNKISNSYFNGSAAYGFIGDIATYSNSNKLSAEVTNSYAISQSGPYFQPKTGLTIVNSLVKDTSHNKLQKYTTAGATPTEETYSDSIMNRQKYYSDLGWDISNTGGVKVDGNGAVTRPTWRIYEGQDTPILTSMTKGIKTVSYNYGYFKADGSLDKKASVRNAVSEAPGIGSNGSTDMPAYDETSQPTGLVYNGETLKIVDKDNNALTTTTANDASSFIKTKGKSTVDASDIKYNTSGQKNSTYEASSGTQNTLAMVWSNQQGYDLVGGNVTIAPRTVKAITDYTKANITKQYDGKSDASDAFKNLFSGNSTTTTGILDVDKAAVKVEFSGSAYFVDSAGKKDASVGKGKNIEFGSNSSISLAFNGDSAKNNYILDTAGTSFTSGQKLTGVGTITQKDLVIGFDSSFYSGGTAINKTYDGETTAAAATDTTFTLTGIVTPEVEEGQTAQKDKVSIDITSATANYIDSTGTATKKAGAHAVRYSGLKLTDDDAKNYRLVDANGDVLYSEAYNGVGADVNKETGGYLDGAGTIDKKNISLGGFSVNGAGQGAEKTYDNTEYYDGALGQKVYSDEVVHNADKTVWDDLTFTVTNDTNGHSGYFTEQEGSTTHVTDADTGYGVGYHVTIGGSDADNYTINGAAITNGSTAEVTGSGGTIKKRVITLALGDTTTDIDKTYDGNKWVKVTHNNQLTSDIALSDGLVKYADGSNQLIATDGTKLSIKGEYDSENVAKSNTYGIGADQGIKYTVSVVDGTISGKAKNYEFVTQGGAATQTITGAKGAINPVHIKNIQFADASKTYDGSELVKGEQAADVISVAGITDGTNSVLVGNEQLSSIIDTNRIIGTYGSGSTDATFAKNAHVQRDDNNNVISGTVKYTGKDTAGAAASLKNSIISDNYVLDIDSEYGTGTINPLTINSTDELTLKHGTITKTYDGSASVAYKDAQGVNHTADEFVSDLYATVGNTNVNLSYTVGNANYGGANGADANVARDGSGNVIKKDVTYKLKVTENGDYAIAAGLKDSNGYVTKVFQTANNDGGIITPRKLKAQAAASGFTKTYDATNVVYAGTTPLAGNGVVTFIGYDNAADGLLTQDQSANNSSAVYDNVDAGKGKAINYTAKIGTGSDAIANNYDIYVSNDNTNWTKGTSFTANNGVINKAGLQVTFDDVNKKYDGNAYLKDTYNNDASLISPNYHGGIKSRSGTADDVHVSFASQEDSVFDSADVARDANGQVTSQNVTYKFTLEGAQAGNYFIADANGNEVTTKEGEKTVLNGRGTISPKNLTDADVTLNFDAVNKVYDTNSNISYNHSAADYGDQAGSQDAADYINQFIIGGVVLKNGQTDTKGENYSAAGIYLNSAGTETSGVDANKAEFTISLTDKAVSNFDLSSVSFYNSTTKTLTKTTGANTASITPKNVTVSFHDPEVTKVYNGKVDVVTGSTQQNPDGTALVVGTDILNVSGIISGDKAELDRGNINARYKDKDVAYDSADKVKSKDVYYDAVLKGDNAANYKLVYGTQTSSLNTANKPLLTLTGKGTITPKEISADFNYNGNVAAADYNKKTGDTTANKAYDGENTVNSLSSKTINGVNGEVIQLNDDSITGTYGKWTTDASGAETGIGAGGQTEKGSFTANEDGGDVNWLGTGSTEDEKTGYKAVKYTGLQQALENATDVNSTAGFSGKNYTIADTVYFTEAAQKGKIRQLSLTADDIHEKWTTPITKEYDGDDVVQNAKDHFGLYTDVTGSNIDIKYKLQSAVYDNGQVNVVSGHGVTYTLNDLEPQEFNNFKMDAAMLNSFKGKKYTNTGSITPRVLKLDFTHDTGLDKIYDGTAAVTDAKANDYSFVVDHDILNNDVTLTVSSVYADKNANAESAKAAQGSDGKTVKHTVELSGNAEKLKNYTIASLDTNGAVRHKDETTYTGSGDIIKRTVYVDNDSLTDIDKPYDGTTNLVAGVNETDYRGRFHAEAVDDGAQTGIVDNDVSLNTAGIKVAYAGKDVKYEQGNLAAQEVVFSDFALKDNDQTDGHDDAQNYLLVVRKANKYNQVIGSGKIKPKELTVTVNNSTALQKDYDGTEKLGENDTEKAAQKAALKGYLTVADTGLVSVGGTKDTINFTVADGSYASKDAGDNIRLTYTVNWDNKNYKPVFVAKDTNAALRVGNKQGSAELSTQQGKITPRVLTVTGAGDAEKTYDSTKFLSDAQAGKNIQFSNIAADETVNDLQAIAKGVYDGTDAADSEDVPEKEYTVTYTDIKVGNTNYTLAPGAETSGKGVIHRAGLTVVADSYSVRANEPLPSLSGIVTGWQGTDAAAAGDFTFESAVNSTQTPGKYAVYGWYTNAAGERVKSGNYGKNYTFHQAPGNETALVVEMVNPGREYSDTVNPKGQFRPDMTAYQQASEDTVGGFNAGTQTAVEYRDVNGAVIGTLAVDNGDINQVSTGSEFLEQENNTRRANIGIAGAEIVNMNGVDAASSASVDVDGDGSVVNLEIESIVPASTLEADTIVRDDDKDGEIAIEQIGNKDEEKKNSKSIGVETTGAGVNMAS